MTTRASSRILLAAAVLVLCVAESAPRAQAPSTDVPERYRAGLATADSLAEASRLDTAIVLLQPLIRDARRHDRRVLAMLVQRQAEWTQRQGGDPRRAAREALDLSTALRDTVGMMAALSLFGTRDLDHDGLVEPAVEWLLRLSLDRDDYRYESRARTIAATDALAQGQPELARRGFARALELARMGGDWRAELDAVTGLGRVAFALDDLDQARESHRKVARIAEDHRDDLELGRALRDLAGVERVSGDLEAAIEDDRRAWAVLRRIGKVRDWIEPALEVATLQKHLETYDEAETTLVHVATACDSLRQPTFLAQALAERAEVLERQGRAVDAARIARQGLAIGRALPPASSARLAEILGRALAEQDSSEAAFAVIDRERRTARQLSPPDRADLEARRAELLARLGRPGEALDGYLRARRSAPSTPAWRPIELLAGAAQAELELVRAEAAAARIAEAARLWAADSIPPVEPWDSERRRLAGRSLLSAMVDLAIARSGDQDSLGLAPELEESLQPFRRRALLEGTLGPRGADAAPLRFVTPAPTIDSLRRSLLGADELLLDLWLGSRDSYLFAITRDSAKWVRLPAANGLLRRAGIYTDLISRGPSGVDPAAWDSSAARLGEALLGDVADLVAAHRRIVFAADGEIAGLPLGSLILADSGGTGVPLGTHHEIVCIPSIAWWPAPERPGPEPGRVLGLAGPVEDTGPAPPGSGELDDLRSRYQGVDVESSERWKLGAVKTGADVMHLIARVRLDDHHPWYSGILVERPSSPDRDPYWRTGQLAGARLGIRLVVLSRCEPARGHAVPGEGAQALATALLSAGADAVILNRWPLDDATAARWANAFYAALAGGQTAAQAMMSAQQALRSDPATVAPRDWAGFVLFGDGDARVPLKARPRWWWPTIVGAGVVIAAFALVIGARRRHARALLEHVA